jgi:hypothetical protein
MRATKVLVGFAVAGLMVAGTVTTASSAPRETVPPSASAPARVETPVRGGAVSGVPGAARVTGPKSSNGISYHGGPVMNGGVHAYVIWYGNWSANTATSILPTLLGGLSGSPYNNINTTYYDGSGLKVPNSVAVAGQITDNYSQGAVNLSDSQIQTVVSSAITSGRLPVDAAGVYFVLTSADVTKSGFLTSYCGWHTHATIAGTDVKYSFVGDPGTNGACSMQTTTSPNGNVGADAMASVIAHELEEAATDPALNAWYDTRGYENADKCAWTFGTTYTVSNGSKANMKLGGLDFLIQRNWVNASGGYCSLTY